MLHIFYRYTPNQNEKRRPPFFSKELCLCNFLHALESIPTYELHFISDGKLDEKMGNWIVEKNGIIEILPSCGNSASFWYVYKKAIELPDSHHVYFVEDDYLHLPNAFSELIVCFEDLPNIDYITLYDHPVRYMLDYPLGADWPVDNGRMLVTKSHHWRMVESITMTFASTPKTLREDKLLFDKYVRQTEVPSDRKLFRHIQSLGSYSNPTSVRRLVSPVPSLATHCEDPWLSPIVDWYGLARGYAQYTQNH